MCFSATASFGASAVLAVVGTACLTKAKTKPQKVFGSIPILFSIQQLTEGLLWLSIQRPAFAPYETLFTYTFLFFAMAVWPFWIPFSVWLLEKDARRKKIIRGFLWAGAIVAVGVSIILFAYPVQVVTPFCFSCENPAQTAATDHLHYDFAIPGFIQKLIVAFSVLYIAATIITPFISGNKKMKGLGIVFLLSYLFAIMFYHGFVISVWCFFAALLSFVVLWIILDFRNNDGSSRLRSMP